MKHIKLMALTALAVLSVARAEVVAPVDKVSSHVNVRQQPASGAEVVGRLDQGDSIAHLGTENGWRKVRLDDGVVGYISADWTVVLVDDAADDEVNGIADDIVAPAAGANAPSVPLKDRTATAASTLTTDEGAGLDNDDGDESNGDADSEAAMEVAAAEPGPDSEADPTVEPGADGGAVGAQVVTGTAAGSAIDAAAAPVPSYAEVPAEPDAGWRPAVGRIEGGENYLVKFIKSTIGGNSQIWDDGNNIGIGTTDPKQRLEVNGSIQIHEQNSSVAGLMITQSSGETGYIMHNRASTLTIGAGSVDRLTIDRAGNVGLGQSRPTYPLEMASGAHVTAGGVWTNSSSIVNKENVESLTPEEALTALAALEPVLFNYKADRADRHVGFIAEDVPDLVATADRKGLSSMDIVAVLTRVVQQQQLRIDELERRLSE